MNILAIETSCDDTCIAVVEAKGRKNPSFKILSNIVSSQVKIHRKWGGIYPTLAKREHQRNLPIVFNKALQKAGFVNPKSQILNPKQIQNSKSQISKLDLIGVTVGPGLEPCLWTGVNFAKKVSENLKLPIIPVNHIEAHIMANWLTPIRQIQNSKIKNQKLFPAVCLIVSGGHTQLILMKDIGAYKILGETRDDAAGECFDKVARILGLGYPGGPAIAEQAAKLKTNNYKLITKLPRPMIYQKNYDFSFSGLKTAVLYKVRSMKYEETKKKKFIQGMSKEIQQAIIDVLIYKTLRAAKEYKVKTLIIGGGVAANDELRKQFNYKLKTINYKLNFLVPAKNFCTDNAAMVTVAGYYRWLKAETRNWREVKANANLRID